MSPDVFGSRLETAHFPVRKLIQLALEGRLRLPPFQRSMRWQKEDHRKLLDSLLHGYPVGTLLLWKRPAPAARLAFGPVFVNAPALPDAYWIVDGQQRLTSLVACFMHPEVRDARRTDPFLFDLDLQEGTVEESRSKDGVSRIPVSTLFDSSALSDWMTDRRAPTDLRRRAEALRDVFRDYEVPAYITHADRDEELRIIFERVNSSGQPMRAAEIFDALNTSAQEEAGSSARALRLTETLQAHVFSLGFGLLPARTLLKALVCVAGQNPRDDLPPALRTPDAARAHLPTTQRALERVVGFLVNECGIPHARILPYELPVILLAGFFHHFPDPSERSIELLVRWVWRGVASEKHEASNVNLVPYFRDLDQAIKAHDPDEEALVQRWLSRVPKEPPSVFPCSVTFSLTRNMKARLEVCALFRLKPRHLLDGRCLTVAELLEPGEAPAPLQLFPLSSGALEAAPSGAPLPPSFLRLPASKEAQSQTAVQLLHPPLHRASARTLPTLLTQCSEETLASHGLLEVRPALMSHGVIRWDDVVAARRMHLAALVDTLIRHEARYAEDDDGPSIAWRMRQMEHGEES